MFWWALVAFFSFVGILLNIDYMLTGVKEAFILAGILLILAVFSIIKILVLTEIRQRGFYYSCEKKKESEMDLNM